MKQRKPCFDNLLKVVHREVPDRATLFELFLNGPLYERFAGRPAPAQGSSLDEILFLAEAYAAAGYDYVTVYGSKFTFSSHHRETKKTISLNDGGGIVSRSDFEDFPWPDPEEAVYSNLALAAPLLPEGMKMMVLGPSGVLENVISLVGYDNLCYMVYDEPELAGDIFNAVGERLLRYYELSLYNDAVGIVMVNDDWGFNTQTFLSPEGMARYVYPWHKKIVNLAHEKNRPAVLHSCGNLDTAMEDVIETIGFDAKHSYEDSIIPVEDAYEKWGRRIAILGGMDVDFVTRSTPEKIKRRSLAMLERTRERGGYALGTGNSVPEYIPVDHYFAMTSAALDSRD